MRLHVVGLDLQRLPISVHRRSGVDDTLARRVACQQLGLEQPGVGVVGLPRQQRVHFGQRAGGVAVGGGQAGTQQQRRAEVGRLSQRLVDRFACAGQVVLAGQGNGQLGFQFGIGLRFGQLDLAELLQQQRALAQAQHRAGQQRQHGGFGVAALQCAAQLGLGAGDVTGVEHQLAEQKTRFGRIGLALQQRFQLQTRGLDLVFGQVAAGRSQQVGGRRLAAAGQRHDTGQRDRGHRRPAGAVAG